MAIDLSRWPHWTCEDRGITLICADCLSVLPQLEAGSVDAVVTDPPYGIGDRTGWMSEIRQHKNEYEGFEDTLEYVKAVAVPAVEWGIENCRSVVLTPGSKALFCYPNPQAIGGFYQPAAVGICSWGRQTFQPILFYGRDPRAGRDIQHTTYVLTEPAEPNGHPCPKPLRAWTWVTTRASQINDVVLDCFMGSGTTGVACVRTGRRFIGIEKEERYFDIAVRRIKAELERYPLLEAAPQIVQRTFNEDIT